MNQTLLSFVCKNDDELVYYLGIPNIDGCKKVFILLYKTDISVNETCFNIYNIENIDGLWNLSIRLSLLSYNCLYYVIIKNTNTYQDIINIKQSIEKESFIKNNNFTSFSKEYVILNGFNNIYENSNIMLELGMCLQGKESNELTIKRAIYENISIDSIKILSQDDWWINFKNEYSVQNNNDFKNIVLDSISRVEDLLFHINNKKTVILKVDYNEEIFWKKYIKPSLILNCSSGFKIYFIDS